MSSDSARLIYLDTNIFIYAVEGITAYVSIITRLFERVSAGELLAVTSELTLAEVLVRPMREGRSDVIDAYQRALQSVAGLNVEPVTRTIWIEAAQIRATTNLPLADAIHLATAKTTNCQLFLSNDRRIPAIADLIVTTLDKYR